ncbi:hypothetical protein [Delftia tsuruhatensis]|uniref:hypothetical protein n=1 Tax=Delftia tsuruhatensis TaxID=180282 RepID=UPI00244B9B3A|nr:hypothetical protein [Delftia tsuruhatensis]MDH0423651.1 hypothetical protein [Delftia tsuruhatensis]
MLGFHGTDEETVDKILNDPKQHLKKSANTYDWLGGGIYFWENDPHRALSFAEQRMRWAGVKDKKAKVIGAIIDLGLCLNLTEQPALLELKRTHEVVAEDFRLFDDPLPVNGADGHLWSRDLDCLVIETLHRFRRNAKPPLRAYDSVRSPFQEGGPVYEGTEFRLKNHIQIAVINEDCIKGYFLPRGVQFTQ